MSLLRQGFRAIVMERARRAALDEFAAMCEWRAVSATSAPVAMLRLASEAACACAVRAALRVPFAALWCFFDWAQEEG